MVAPRRTLVAAVCAIFGWLAAAIVGGTTPCAANGLPHREPVRAAQPAATITTVEVLDALTDAPLPDALVQCDGGSPVLTNLSGRATVPPCPSIVDVSLDGYVPQRLAPPHATDPLVIRLVAISRAAESVTVVGPAAGQTEVGVPAQIAVSRQELAMLRSVTFDDPLRTLQQLPGVGTSDELRAELSVRGSPFRQVGLVLDEVKSRLLVHTVRGVEQTGSVALLNADLVDAATLTPGAGPQRFGNTVGAELAIRTRAGRASWHGRGMASAIASTGYVEGPIGSDRVTFVVGARRSYASWIVRRIDPDVSGTFEFVDAQAKLDARLSSRHTLSAGFLGGTSAYDERGRRSSANALDLGRNRTAMGTLAWQAQVGSRWLVRQRVAAITSTYRNQNPDGRPLDRGTEHEWLSRSIVEWAPRASLSMDAAVQVQRFVSTGTSIVYAPATRLPDSDVPYRGAMSLTGGHVHARWTPRQALALGAGARVDAVPGLPAFPGGWVSAQLALSRSLFLTAAASRHGQAPDVLQRFGPAGTADLRFETARLLDAGLGWRRGVWGVALNVYDRREYDGLDTPERQFRIDAGGRIAGGQPRAPWQNALTGRARGAEVLLRRQPATTSGVRWSGWIGYGYGRATYEGTIDPGFAGAFDQRHLLTVSATAQVGEHWDASTTVRVATNWPYEGWFEERGTRGIFLSTQRNALRLPDYARLDVRVRRRLALPHGRLLLFAEVINAANARNLRQVSASLDLRTGAVGRLSERQLPIIPAIGLAYEF